MSRGPGRWQRAVIEACNAAALDDEGLPLWVSVEDVALSVDVGLGRAKGQHLEGDDDVPDSGERQHLDRSTREAIRRAMRTLDAAGAITTTTVLEWRDSTKDWYGVYEGDGPCWWEMPCEVVRRTLRACRPLTDDETARARERDAAAFAGIAPFVRDLDAARALVRDPRLQ